MSLWRWLVLAVVGIGLAVIVWNVSTPEYEKEARAARRLCESIARKGLGDLRPCQEAFDRAMKDGELKDWAERHPR